MFLNPIRGHSCSADPRGSGGQRWHGDGSILPLVSSPPSPAHPLARTLDPKGRRPRGNHEHAAGRAWGRGGARRLAPSAHLRGRAQCCVHDQPFGCRWVSPELLQRWGREPGSLTVFSWCSVSEEAALQRLCSDSVLLIRRDDVLQRATPDCSLSTFSENQSDPRWKALDVAGKAATSGAHFVHWHLMVHTISGVYRSGEEDDSRGRTGTRLSQTDSHHDTGSLQFGRDALRPAGLWAGTGTSQCCRNPSVVMLEG